MPKPEDMLENVLSGELTREEAIRQTPEMEDRLLRLTDLADELQALPQHKPDPDFRNRTRMRLLQHIQEARQRRRWWQRALDPVHGLPGWASTISAVAIACGGLTFGVSYASASALPDDRLYPVKRAVEQVQVAMASSGEAQANTYLDLADRRAAEIAATAGDLDENKLQGLTQDYGDALLKVTAAVQTLPSPPMVLLNKVQAHVASQATELEARALNSSARPVVQEQLVQAEVVASNTVDHVTLVAEKTGKPGPQDVHLAANAPAAATAAASVPLAKATRPTSHVAAAAGSTAGAPGGGSTAGAAGSNGSTHSTAAPGAGTNGPTAGAPGGGSTAGAAGASRTNGSVSGAAGANNSTSGVNASSNGANAGLSGTAANGSTAGAAGVSSTAAGVVGSEAGGVPSAGLDGELDHLWNQVAAAPFMGQRVRTQLEVDVANAKQNMRAGRKDAAITDMDAFVVQLEAAVTAHQATQYTSTRLVAESKAILAALQSPAQLGLRIVP